MGNDRARRQAGTRQHVDRPGGPGSRVHFGRRAGQAAELGKVERAAEILDFIVKAGDAVMVSGTSDGGALVVTILAGDAREKAYAVGQMELDNIFQQLEDAYSPGP